MKRSIFVLTILATALAGAPLTTPALAAGSGGGGGLPATSGPSVDPAAAYQEGVAALQAKDYKTAEKKFGDVLSVASKNPEANYYMALAKIGNGKTKNAVRYLEKAIKARGNFVEAREKLALVSVELGDAEAAEEQLAAIRALKDECAAQGDCEADYVARVDVAIERVTAALSPAETAPAVEGEASEEAAESVEGEGDQPGDAAAPDEQALFFAPRSDGVARYLAAVRLINEARYSEAIAELDRSAAIVGPHPDILNYLGFSHRKLGQFDKAKAYYAEALAIDPDHKGANEYLGELYLELGDMAKAKQQLAALDRICAFGCAEREDLAKLIARRDGAVAAR